MVLILFLERMPCRDKRVVVGFKKPYPKKYNALVASCYQATYPTVLSISQTGLKNCLNSLSTFQTYSELHQNGNAPVNLPFFSIIGLDQPPGPTVLSKERLYSSSFDDTR